MEKTSIIGGIDPYLLKAKNLIATLKILQQLLTRTLPNIW